MNSKIYKVVYSPLADRDLREAWRHIAQEDIAAADRFFDSISAKTKALTLLPERGAPRTDLGRGLRMLVEGKYLIFYRIDKNVVRITRVLHGSKDLTQLLI